MSSNLMLSAEAGQLQLPTCPKSAVSNRFVQVGREPYARRNVVPRPIFFMRDRLRVWADFRRPFWTFASLVAISWLSGCGSLPPQFANRTTTATIEADARRQASLVLGPARRLVVPSARVLAALARPHAENKEPAAVRSGGGAIRVFVSDSYYGDVDMFNDAGLLVKQIKGFNLPQGIALTSDDTLLIASTDASNVPIYAKPYNKMTRLLKDPGEFPSSVAMDERTGTIGITNIISRGGGAGSVSFYQPGSSTRCLTLTSSAFDRVPWGTFDASGNFYIDGTSPDGGFLVGVVTGLCKATAIQPLTVDNSGIFPGGLEVTSTGRLLVTDVLGQAIYGYHLPAKNGTLGPPVSVTHLVNSVEPSQSQLTSNGEAVWTADFGHDAAVEYRFPRGGVATKAFLLPGSSLADGIALSKEQRP